MPKKMFLQEFELFVLLAILRLGDEAYGAAIARELETTADRTVSIGALYATLGRLVDKGLLMSHTSDPLPVRGGRARKHYTLTGTGEVAVTHAATTLRRMMDGIDLLTPSTGTDG
jgi:PadR family transcriptional regulator PadR